MFGNALYEKLPYKNKCFDFLEKVYLPWHSLNIYCVELPIIQCGDMRYL